EHHIVDAIGHNRPTIPHQIDMGAIDAEDAAGDLVRRTGSDLTIAVDRFGLQALHHKPATLVAAATYEDAAAQNGCAVAASREAGEIRADDDVVVSLHVPQGESALQDVDAVA